MSKKHRSLIQRIDRNIADLQHQLEKLRNAQSILKSNTDRPVVTMIDGSIYVGVSPDTDRPLYVMPQDLPERHHPRSADRTAASLSFGGQSDWRVPSMNELKLLYINRVAIGGFNEGRYWTSTESNDYNRWYQCFKNGYLDYHRFRNPMYNVRCVRG